MKLIASVPHRIEWCNAAMESRTPFGKQEHLQVS